MPINEPIEQAQACRHARHGNWDEFSKTVTELIREVNRQGRYGNNGSDWFAVLWCEFALDENAKALGEYSQWLMRHRGTYGHRLPTLSSLVHAASKDPRMQWVLHREDLHDIWVAGTDVPVPNKEWRAAHKVEKDTFAAYTTWMQKQPESLQEIQKLYLERHGIEALAKKPLLYYAMCAYGTPTKEQVKHAALSSNPIYDMRRLEEHFPGITAFRSMYEGMDFAPGAVRDGIRKFIEGTIKAPEQITPEHGFG